MKKIGLQLYTVRKCLSTPAEMRRTLKAVKEAGYTAVQLFGSVELAKAHGEAAREAGLELIGLLTDLSQCEQNGTELFDFCRQYHIKDIGVSTHFEECKDPKAYIGRVNAFARKAVAAGFTFSYHNHGHEFIRLDAGKTPMECFLEGFGQEVRFMPDTYWIHDGGYDVRYFLEQTKGRVQILHLKDMKRTEEGHTFAEVGNGNLYFKGILATALRCGIETFVVEQDICPADPLESIKQSYGALKGLLEE